MQNQQTRELIKRSKYVTQVQQQSPVSPTVTRYITLPEVHPRCVLLKCHKHTHSCSLQLFDGGGDDDFSISQGGCTSGGGYVPCIYTHAR